jgi:hypothetical protein
VVCTIANIISQIDFVALATIVMAVFTGCLVIYNKKMWKSTNIAAKAAQKAAEAAKNSAESLPRIETAYVFVEIEHVAIQKTGAVGQTYIDDSQIIVNILFCNHGRTPAIIREIVIYWGNEGNPPRAYRMEIPPGSVILRDKPFKRRVQIDTPKGEIYFCWGTIAFEDIFRDIYTTGFHWHWNDWVEHFEISNNDELNYYNKKI